VKIEQKHLTILGKSAKISWFVRPGLITLTDTNKKGRRKAMANHVLAWNLAAKTAFSGNSKSGG